jgi:hypothetical protein
MSTMTTCSRCFLSAATDPSGATRFRSLYLTFYGSQLANNVLRMLDGIAGGGIGGVCEGGPGTRATAAHSDEGNRWGLDPFRRSLADADAIYE